MGAAAGKGLSGREKWLIAAIVVIALVAVFAIFARPAGPGAGEAGQPTGQPDAAGGSGAEAGGSGGSGAGSAGSGGSGGSAGPAGPGGADASGGSGAGTGDGASGTGGTTAATAEPQRLSELARRDADDPMAVGDVDAPVVMIEYADYRCPYCGLYATETQPEVVRAYVETGLVRIEFRDVPIFGEQSQAAAVAARAAGEQGLFWEYNAAVFALAEQGGHTDLPRERLLAIAAEVGVPDLARFEANLDSPELAARVQADLDEARTLGFNSTPSFIVGDKWFAGAYPIEAFREVIDAELDRLGAAR